MLHIVVVDASAESRQRLVDRYQGFIRAQIDQFPLLPRASIRPLSIHEIKFHAAPDICVIGPELVSADLLEVSRVRAAFPRCSILVALDHRLNSLGTIEQVARLGADDVLLEQADGVEFVRKLILLGRKAPQKNSGLLVVVDGAKGGVGVTSLVAAIGETLIERGKSVALIDGDFESQDLSRFLQARPFINEPLRLLLDEQRPVTDEFVDQCLVPVWAETPSLRVLTPPPETDDLWSPSARQTRIFATVFEVLDSSFDVVVVDSGSLRGMFRELLLKIADRILCVVSNDPASLFASIDRVERIRRSISSEVEITLIENSLFPGGVSNQLLRDEFSRAARIEAAQWTSLPVPFCRKAARWPASGGTLISQGSSKTEPAISAIVDKLGLAGAPLAAAAEKVSLVSRLIPWRTEKRDVAAGSPHMAVASKRHGIAAEPAPLSLPPPLSAEASAEVKLGEAPAVLSIDRAVSRARLAS